VLTIIAVYTKIEQNNKPMIFSSILIGDKSCQTIYGDDAENVAEKIKIEISKLEEKISHEIEDSDISKLNNSSKWVKSEKTTIEILEKVIDVSRQSSGVFDPTALNLFQEYGLISGQIRTLNNERVSEMLENVDFRLLKIDKELERIKLENPNAAVTLDLISKGAACHQAIKIYENSKINRAIISIGTVTGVYGKKPNGESWNIPIKNPYKNEDIAMIQISNGFVASFGTINDKILFNGQKVNRIINARTGQIGGKIDSAIVLYPDGIIANALACVCVLLGNSDSFNILNYYGAEAIFIKNNVIEVTSKLIDKIKLLDDQFELRPCFQ
jgi:thiamine biosynthesis lipoprotein